MKVSDPIIIGYPAVGEPTILGSLADHGLPGDLLIGTTVDVNDRLFIFNVSYAPQNPKRERLVGVLMPKERLEDDFWTETQREKEEFPF